MFSATTIHVHQTWWSNVDSMRPVLNPYLREKPLGIYVENVYKGVAFGAPPGKLGRSNVVPISIRGEVEDHGEGIGFGIVRLPPGTSRN